MPSKYWWIKERYNPQLGVYYVACGNIPQATAKRMADSLYGTNVMHPYKSKELYVDALSDLLNEGGRVQGYEEGQDV